MSCFYTYNICYLVSYRWTLARSPDRAALEYAVFDALPPPSGYSDKWLAQVYVVYFMYKCDPTCEKVLWNTRLIVKLNMSIHVFSNGLKSDWLGQPLET